jgi:hypothetical protein
MTQDILTQGIDNLHNHPNCTDYIHNLLDIIEKDMLVVLSTDQGRERSPVLLNKLTSMHQNCINDANYCSEKTPRRRLFRAPTGTIARLGSEAKGMVNKNNMRNKLTPNILQPGKSYHRSLRKEDLENVDGFAWPRES